MTQAVCLHSKEVVKHLYISPLEFCNLCCRMCYTAKTQTTLAQTSILDFLARYRQAVDLQSVTFCGGETFLLPDFPDTINKVTNLGVFVQVITNGTVDKLDGIDNPNLVNLIVSVDGLEKAHDKNRGQGRWRQSVDFLRKAVDRGFHYEVFSIVTAENMPEIPEFEKTLASELGGPVSVTYHPRKPMAYLTKHPVSNRVGDSDGLSFITSDERVRLGQSKKIFPPVDLGCYQISLMSDGNVYGCCEGIHPLGAMTDEIPDLVAAFHARIEAWFASNPNDDSLGCVEPEFTCGLPCR